jgi:hypothetical protein
MLFKLQLDAQTLDLILEGLGNLPHNRVAKVIDSIRAGALEQAAAARKASEQKPADPPPPEKPAPNAELAKAVRSKKTPSKE